MDGQYKVDNAIIMAAGMSSRFAPISYEIPKALLKVKGEILIERQIRQLKEAGIKDITVVVGYKKEKFTYLTDKFSVDIVENPEYNIKNNNSTLYHVRKKLRNTYICSGDNYFAENVFKSYVDKPFYSAVFKKGKTEEWCITTDGTGLISGIKVGGENSWVMLGHVFFDKDFSTKFVDILEKVYHRPETAPLLWESIYMDNIKELSLYIKKYPDHIIFEFDTLEELREFDNNYYNYSDSKILNNILKELGSNECDIINICPINNKGQTIGFKFTSKGKRYKYFYKTNRLIGEDIDKA